jgi:hypothetical protein
MNTKMSKAIMDGLKSHRVKPSIPYIPEKDELQEAVESTALIKLTWSTKVELQVSVWSHGTPQ